MLFRKPLSRGAMGQRFLGRFAPGWPWQYALCKLVGVAAVLAAAWLEYMRGRRPVRRPTRFMSSAGRY